MFRILIFLIAMIAGTAGTAGTASAFTNAMPSNDLLLSQVLAYKNTGTMMSWRWDGPVPEDGYLYIDDHVLFVAGGVAYYVGDTYSRGHDVNYWYWDPHPLPWGFAAYGSGAGWCMLEGPHAHWWGPNQLTNYTNSDGYIYYVGTWNDRYWRAYDRHWYNWNNNRNQSND